MTFSSSKMMNAFRSSNVLLVQLDTTFDLDKARYKLIAVVYLNPIINKSEVSFMNPNLTWSLLFLTLRSSAPGLI